MPRSWNFFREGVLRLATSRSELIELFLQSTIDALTPLVKPPTQIVVHLVVSATALCHSLYLLPRESRCLVERSAAAMRHRGSAAS